MAADRTPPCGPAEKSVEGLRARQRRERVLDLVEGRWRFERGDGDLGTPSHVAVLAHWSESPRVTRSFCTLVRELQEHSYQVVVSSAAEGVDTLQWSEGVDETALVVVRKPNAGYDFGSWSLAMHVIPDIAAADRVLVANDSMIGPFQPLRPLLQQFDETSVDVWGLTDTYQFGYHLQSYFFGFAGGILQDPPLRAFWVGICQEPTKADVIRRNEVGLGRLLWEEGYVQGAAYPFEELVAAGENPVIIGWRRLLERGFPFLKREILRNPLVAPGGASAAAVVRRLTGCELHEWIAAQAS